MNKAEVGYYHHNIKVIKIDQMKEEIDLENPDVDKSATVKEKGESTDKDREDNSHISKVEKFDTLNKEIDIDLDDPDVDKAALKIQSSFRGYKARKEVLKRKKKPAVNLIIGNTQNTKANNIEKERKLT